MEVNLLKHGQNHPFESNSEEWPSPSGFLKVRFVGGFSSFVAFCFVVLLENQRQEHNTESPLNNTDPDAMLTHEYTCPFNGGTLPLQNVFRDSFRSKSRDRGSASIGVPII